MRVDDEVVGLGGSIIPKHQARAIFRPEGFEDGKTAQWLFDGEDLEFGDSSETRPDLNPLKFVEMSKVVPGYGQVSKGCIGSKPNIECLIDGRPALAGRVQFRGGEIRPLNVSNIDPESASVFLSSRPADIVGFRSIRPEGVKSEYVKSAPTGLVFSRIVDAANFALHFAGEDVKLDVAPKSECKKFGSDPTCYIITIVNIAVPDPGSSAHSVGAMDNSEKHDTHFELFYKLLKDPDCIRLLPFRKSRPTNPHDDPPESRCIQPLLTR
jgi:hypothetical protein